MKTQDQIKQDFYKKQLEFEFNQLHNHSIEKGVSLTINQIIEEYSNLPLLYQETLIEMLFETKYNFGYNPDKEISLIEYELIKEYQRRTGREVNGFKNIKHKTEA